MSQELFLYALRYALGRKTNAPAIVATDIIRNLSNFDDTMLNIMANEIQRRKYSEKYEDLWESLRKDLLHEVDIRTYTRNSDTQ